MAWSLSVPSITLCCSRCCCCCCCCYCCFLALTHEHDVTCGQMIGSNRFGLKKAPVPPWSSADSLTRSICFRCPNPRFHLVSLVRWFLFIWVLLLLLSVVYCISLFPCCVPRIGTRVCIFCASTLNICFIMCCTFALPIGKYFLFHFFGSVLFFMSKSTKLDGKFAPAWIGFGNAFAAQEETDQAVSAYRTAARLFQGSHLALLYIGETKIIIITHVTHTTTLKHTHDDKHTQKGTLGTHEK